MLARRAHLVTTLGVGTLARPRRAFGGAACKAPPPSLLAEEVAGLLVQAPRAWPAGGGARGGRG